MSAPAVKESRAMAQSLHPFHFHQLNVIDIPPRHGKIYREQPEPSGKVICGVRNEISGRSRSSKLRYNPCWRANLPLPRDTLEIGLKRWILIVCAWTTV